MNHEQARELLADFALDLLDYDEVEAVLAHLAACEICPLELRTLVEAGQALALSPEPADLPAGAEARIAAGVRARLGQSSPALAGPIATIRPAARIIPGPWRTIAIGAAAAALLFAVGLTAVSVAWLDARDDRDRLEGQLAARAIELPLSGPNATGTIYVAADFASGVAVFSGLAVAPAQHHYQVWSEGPDGSKSAADFTGGDGALVVKLPQLPKDMTRMFVTIEPDGASQGVPSGPEVLTTPR